MSEILNNIVYFCGAIFIFWCGIGIIGIIILKIKEITYDAHQNLIELRNLKRKLKNVREEIQKCVDMLSDDTVADLNMKSGLGIALEKIDKLIESEGENDT